MAPKKRIAARARTAIAVLIGIALAACSGGTYPGAGVQMSASATRASDSAASQPVLPEIVVTATRLTPPRVAEQTTPRPPAKQRG
jgi:hypothetical protein